MRDDLSTDNTIWVVVKLVSDEFCKEDEPVVEEMGFSSSEYAMKRAAHIRKYDGLEAWVYPVKAVWFMPPSPQGAWTTSPGRELHAYHVPGLSSQPRLSQIVSDVWTSWRQQQADAGNLDEAGLEHPNIDELSVLYQEKSNEDRMTPAKQSPSQLSFPGM